MNRNILLISFTISILVLVCGGADPVHSATFNVTTTQDNVPGSLRAAITAANINGEDDIIYLPAGTYILSGATDDDNNLTGDLDIDTGRRITIIGAGRETTIIDGNKTDRALHILDGTVSISGVTIQDGKSRGGEDEGEDGEDGGGIYNSGILSLTNCSIYNNTAGMGYDGYFYLYYVSCPGGGGSGGGIYNSGTLTLTDCIITNNIAGQSGGGIDVCGYTLTGGHGGGIYNSDTGTLRLTNCTISNNKSGRGFDGGDDHDVNNNGGYGGGIANDGTQELIDCTITFNSSGTGGFGTYSGGAEGRSGHGGGIYNGEIANSTLENCIIRYNYTGSRTYSPSEGDGGGIYNRGALSLNRCTVSNNNTGGGGSGGGIYHANGTLSLTNCCMANNNTGKGKDDYYVGNGGSGGAIYARAMTALTNCTVSSNYTGDGGNYPYGVGGNGGFGGGIYTNNTLNLTHCTIFNNKTGSGGDGENDQDGVGGSGGGIYHDNGIVNIKNTIVANNQIAAEGEGPDCYGTFNSQGYNLIENTNQCAINGVLTGNITGVDPMLEALDDNGGDTYTHALLPGSPAIDAGNSSGIFKDQRGFPRPVDIPDITNVSDASDIGAYEFETSTTISGTITYGETGLADVKVTLTSSNNEGTTTTSTDKNGNYSHTVLYGWSGTITPSKSGYTFTPANRSYANVTANLHNQDFTAVPVVPPQISLNRTQLCFGADTAGHQTGSQTILIANSGGGTLYWTLSTSANWLNCTPTSGSNSGVITVSVDPSGLTPGTYDGTITVEDHNASNSPQNVTVTLNVYDPHSSQAPFGSFDTPLHGSTVRSSIPVTGWVIDNIGIERVKIYRDSVPGEGSGLIYIGDAILVEGARPDIEALYPDYPLNYKAGWGYMMLTNFLPNQGNGTFTIHAKAADKEGNIVILGTKTITCDNINAVKPFGAIDTPTQGGTASGSNFVNFGWALTPLPNNIPTDGSTITVWVDGLPLGHPVYNQYRADIAALFPGYNNSNGAVGYYYLDTTQYENGVHTIQWTVTDDAGNTDGIGSRYFTIQNTGESRTKEKFKVQDSYQRFNVEPSSIPVDYYRPVRVKRGYNNTEPKTDFPDENGNITIEIKELERLEIHLTLKNASSMQYSGYMVVGRQLKPLPIGSTLDTKRGVFYWHPGPGFTGSYELVFFQETKTGEILKKTIIVNIRPKFLRD
ncbi:MAG: hypothetical protein GTO45_36675 [Candidatus Aminicenantes bacterium]|nr:hypothetical protein [Candidatus Aminicenantes bacterium]NIM84238.1 hypothetical protein [Candidatus Aminicenantes bacterium]NIN23687.1 hypothetical protein [Candidatus Aminicenantes bacterium]NIN47394.1 hypothetical protein [Candidatus Aminicenantes bacterium]NIN90322.1 hypothetical protein [Candidatus Aminicenantes bacterium]